MKITLTYKNFPFTEESGLWNIYWEDVTSGWAGDGTIKLKATISPNPIKLLTKLADRGYLQKSSSSFNIVVQCLQLGIAHNFTSSEFNDINYYLDKISSFCDERSKTITKSAYSLFNALGGNDSCAEKCINKIKAEIYLESDESLLRSFFQYI